MPTGGVNPSEENLKSWFMAGVTCVGMGSQLITNEIIINKDYIGLTNKVKDVLNIISKLR
jgi:2-dehydro-3-deoxyphosphogluconate aldolase / (4S)-4-hydroxy-2-oxoglutarate aldolase